MANTEYEPTPQNVEQKPELNTDFHTPSEIPPEVEKLGVGAQVIPQHPATLQNPDTGQIVAQSASMLPPIIIPDTPENIHKWTKGDEKSALTWRGVFFERLINMAKHFGRQVRVRDSSNA